MKKEDKKNNVFLIIAVVIFALAICCFIGYYILTKNNENNSNNKEKSNGLEEVKLTEDEAKVLLGEVPIPSKYQGWEDSAYLDKKVLLSDMNKAHLIYNAMKRSIIGQDCTEELMKQNGLCDFTYKVEDVKKSLNDIYGENSIELLDKVEDSFLWHCTRVGEVYACSASGGGFCATDVSYYLSSDHYVKYQNAKKDKDYLYLMVKFARIETDFGGANECSESLKPENATIQLYKDDSSDEKILSETLNGSKYYEENASKSLSEKLYEEFGTKFTDYKITYKINGEQYSLVSVEPVQ